VKAYAAYAGLGAGMLGAAGFCAGFFGPILLNPDANQGPLVGIFITGPGGAITGAILGAVLGAIGVERRSALATLASAAGLLVAGTLVACLPEPAYRASIVEFEILRCETPAERKEKALEHWEKRAAAVTWAAPRPGWKEEFDGLAASNPGAVLVVKVARSASVLENRRPWNKGTFAAGPGRTDLPDSYFLPGASCAALPPNARGPWLTSHHASKQWPPETLTGLLNVLSLEPVPAQYAGFLR
jgi:hypothetical protein